MQRNLVDPDLGLCLKTSVSPKVQDGNAFLLKHTPHEESTMAIDRVLL